MYLTEKENISMANYARVLVSANISLEHDVCNSLHIQFK